MTNWLATTIIVVSLLGAAYSLVTALRDRAMDWGHLVALGVVEVLLVLQAVLGFLKLADDEGPRDSATFIGYMLGILLIPAAGAGWGMLERSRWGPGVIVVACLTPIALARSAGVRLSTASPRCCWARANFSAWRPTRHSLAPSRAKARLSQKSWNLRWRSPA